MLIDWLLYGLLTWGLVALLNTTAFKRRPASRGTAWALTVVMFIVSLVAMTALQFLRYRMISDNLGFEIRPRGPLDVVGAFTFSWLFFALLRKSSKPALAPPTEQATPPPPPASPHTVASLASNITGKTGRATMPPAVSPSVPSSAPAEEFWSAALSEFDSASRRPGLWARAFSEAQGNEEAAKANYFRYRSLELEQEHYGRLAERAHEARAQARQAEIALLSEAERAYALLPKGKCPNCSAVIPLSSEDCPNCTAMFGPSSRWRLTPTSETS